MVETRLRMELAFACLLGVVFETLSLEDGFWGVESGSGTRCCEWWRRRKNDMRTEKVRSKKREQKSTATSDQRKRVE